MTPKDLVLRWKSLVEQCIKDTPFSLPLILALIEQESRGIPYIPRDEPDYRWLYKPEVFAKGLPATLGVNYEIAAQKKSWGLGQCMGAVARELGYSAPYLDGLAVPDVGLKYSILHLQGLRKRFSTFPDYISAYNAGSPRKDDSGKYRNQKYVNEFLQKLEYWESVLGTKLH